MLTYKPELQKVLIEQTLVCGAERQAVLCALDCAGVVEGLDAR
jgi:hypothetical protein